VRHDKPAKHLLAILATPPLTTSGARTRGRLQLATEILGRDVLAIANLIDVPTKNVLDIAVVGREQAPWREARGDIASQIAAADAVLLAWGTAEPAGPARDHHRAQVAWVNDVISRRGIVPWTVGGMPRHPSRWQRYTARTQPGLPFLLALTVSLQAG
jgi:hypothetical protein